MAEIFEDWTGTVESGSSLSTYKEVSPPKRHPLLGFQGSMKEAPTTHLPK